MHGYDLIRKIYEEYDRFQFMNYKEKEEETEYVGGRHRQLQRFIGEGEKHILDIGCSRGDFSKFLQGKGHILVGVDISQHAIDICHRRGIEAYRVDIETEDIPDIGCFDVILLLEVIEHLIDPIPVLLKLKEMLTENGCLILSTPNAAYIKHRLDLMLGKLPNFGEDRSISSCARPYNLLHKTPFTIRTLEETLNICDLQIARIEPEEYEASKMWSKKHMKPIRQFLRNTMPSLFAGSILVEARPRKR